MSKTRQPEDPDVTLGRNLAAAFIATQHGIGLDYARRKFQGSPVGPYWIQLGRKVMEDMRAAIDIPPEGKHTIQ
jgi:hypothetical protein